ncbi:MAG: cupin domain-containing protein [Alphaproteobacteria bacterium]|jgi:transcriptional regulator with XRE-family HTH domain|nr:cupin domain-containing protein [Alphaproteobacteria bacterium]MBT4086363.1 cupin domain-containing protein [Alphaproteobacteria bacterium]MBT4546343.1 cupin domain-containing protein [Alphaproteobacteria bacterium]MBT7744505.1 cupin domain-containing protein [Alphaproteobacteria bacterium]
MSDIEPNADQEYGFDLGARLRGMRESHGLSQRELARRAGVTNGMISLIEQNRSSPSVGSLKKVLDGIPVTLADFFAGDVNKGPKIFFAAEDLLEIAGGAVSYRQVGRDLSDKALQMIHERYAPGADTGRAMLSHEAEECGVVIQGQMELTVGNQRKLMGPGEAYYFDSRLPHRFRNTSDEDCVVISACTPPSF